MDLSAGSLRERSKAKRRATILRTALRMFAERGYDATTVADIAVAAEVAPRTVSLYFPTKMDIAMAVANETAARMSATFRDNPTTDYLDVIDLWLTNELQVIDPEIGRLQAAMLAANPALSAHGSRQIAEAMRTGLTALGLHTGLPATHPMTAVVNSSFTAAVSEYMQVALEQGPTPGLRQSFLAYLRGMVDAARAVADRR